MPRGRVRLAAAVAFVAALTMAAPGLAGAPRGSEGLFLAGPGASAHGSAAVLPAAAPSGASPPPASVPANGSASDPASEMAARAVAAAKAAGVDSSLLFLPRPSATPAELAATNASGEVRPLYTGIPAPMGLAYYGLSAGPGTTVDATVLNTTSLEATVEMNATGVRAGDLFNNVSDAFSIQLNAVLTGVTLRGVGGYSFWTQDVALYFPSTQRLELATNLWNFSTADAEVNAATIYGHSVWGDSTSGIGLYFAGYTVPGPVAYPFDLTLTLASTLVGGRDAVNFSVELNSSAHPAENFSSSEFEHDGEPAPYDYVIFNSTAGGGPALSSPSNFTANGIDYNPLGLPDDFELTFGGPGGGTQATLLDADATLGLAYWNGSGYASVPAALDYGSETGETSSGANVAWSDSPTGAPDGLATYGTMTTGPSFLAGLWNASGAEGSDPVTIAVTPANAFEVLTPSSVPPSNFSVPEAAVAPTADTDVVHLVPGSYTLLTELSGYDPVTTDLNVSGPMWENLTLTPDLARGIYTPLWAFSNTEVAALSTGGSGTPASPYEIETDQPAPIASTFGLYNDYDFPVFAAVFFDGTNASVVISDPPTFATLTNPVPAHAPALPSENDLQYWFWNVSHLALVNATNISGWFAYPPPPSGTFTVSVGLPFNQASVVFFEGGDNLVANDTFREEGGAALLMYEGPRDLGGGNNTVWGNRFLHSAEPRPSAALSGIYFSLVVAESNDLIYDNEFAAQKGTAYELAYNDYSDAFDLFHETFNISRQPATDVHFAPGFPWEPLSGSVVGTLYQGGNYWWDYGLVDPPDDLAQSGDAYGELPYTEGVWIYSVGDWVPLVPFSLYSVTVEAPGLDEKVLGNLTIDNTTSGLETDAWQTNGSSPTTVELPNGTYSLALTPLSGWNSTPLRFSVEGANTSVTLPVAQIDYTVTFQETGLPAGAEWSVNVTNHGTVWSTATVDFFFLANGSHPFWIGDVHLGPEEVYLPSPATGGVTVTGGRTTVSFAFLPLEGDIVSFVEKGLPAGSVWTLDSGASPGIVNDTTERVGSTGGSRGTISVARGAGPFDFEILAPAGYGVAKITGAGSPNQTGGVVSQPLTVWTVTFGALETLTFAEGGSPSSTLYSGAAWSVSLTPSRAAGGPAPQTGSTEGTSIAFDVPAGATYRYTVVGPGAEYRVLPGLGSIDVPTHSVTRTEQFRLLTQPVVFHPRGLESGSAWTVTISSGSSPAIAYPVVASGPGALRFNLPVGTYTYTISATGTELPSPASGSFQVLRAPSPAQAIDIDFT